jgi:nitrogen regulatory protein PII
MREIKAVIQPFMLSKVLEALRGIPELPGITLSHVRGYGGTHGYTISSFWGSQRTWRFLW